MAGCRRGLRVWGNGDDCEDEGCGCEEKAGDLGELHCGGYLAEALKAVFGRYVLEVTDC